jgi:replicative DNA helicase
MHLSIASIARMRARIKRAASDIAQLAYDESSDDDQVNDRAEQLIFQSRRSTGARTIQPLSQTVVEYFNRIEYLYEHRGEPLGVPTGLIDLDK